MKGRRHCAKRLIFGQNFRPNAGLGTPYFRFRLRKLKLRVAESGNRATAKFKIVKLGVTESSYRVAPNFENAKISMSRGIICRKRHSKMF